MQMKQFEAATEALAIEKAQMELGADVIIVGVREIKPKGILKLFKSSTFEATAAYEPQKSESYAFISKYNNDNKHNINKTPKNEDIKEKQIREQQERIKTLEQKLIDTEILFDNVVLNLSKSIEEKRATKKEYDSEIIALFYDTLIKNEVLPDVAKEVLKEADELISKKPETDINIVVKMVYNKIIKIIGTPHFIEAEKMSKENTEKIFFFGPTGVGKTTTIAKLSAGFMLDDNKEVALVTADTYRIAAVEQLKTYADILSLPLSVCYDKDELKAAILKYENKKDVIFIDTAGRSHKNEENKQELKGILEENQAANRYLVLSMTTKMDDMFRIISSFAEICDFNIIFTKADETNGMGAVLNVCSKTGIPVSYITTGQSVPDDIEIIEPEKIARALLGSNE